MCLLYDRSVTAMFSQLIDRVVIQGGTQFWDSHASMEKTTPNRLWVTNSLTINTKVMK
jgi:hypothetical protein